MNNATRETFLVHHGVQGMHWGVRNYQPYDQGYIPKKKGKYIGDNADRSLTRGVPTNVPKRRPTGKNDPILGIDESWVNQARNNVFKKLGPVDRPMSPLSYPDGGTGELYNELQEEMDALDMTEEEFAESLGVTTEELDEFQTKDAKRRMESAVYELFEEYMKTPLYSYLNDGQRHTEAEFLTGSARLLERIYQDLGALFNEDKIAQKVLKEDKDFKKQLANQVGELLNREYRHHLNVTTSWKNPLKGKRRQKQSSGETASVKRRGQGLTLEKIKKQYPNLPGYATDAIYRSQDKSGKSYRDNGVKVGALQTNHEKLKKQYPNLPDYAIDAMLRSRDSTNARKFNETNVERLVKLSVAKRKSKG